MNVVIWARVSSGEQREGYSIDAQLRATRDKAKKAGFHVVREFSFVESAKRSAVRKAFNEMYAWLKANARRENIQAILSHKLDRVCRNMRDAVRLQELEDACGVQLSFVENQFGPGAAGMLSFNVMAAVAQYYSDNLREEVLKGMNERMRQGWPLGNAPFGYRNVKDSAEPVQPHPEKSLTLIRVFELFSTGAYTFKSLADQLASEGHIYRRREPRFKRTSLSRILNNRFYIGELRRNGQIHKGKYKLLIDRDTFERCQDILRGRNRRTGSPQLCLSGGLIRCAHCGSAITGEHIRRKLIDGTVRDHVYYRCANNDPDPEHPRVRWRAADLEQAILDDLARLAIPSPKVADWFRTAVSGAFGEISTHQRRQSAVLAKRRSELQGMSNKLLNAYLLGSVDEHTFQMKSAELKSEGVKVEEAIVRLGEIDPKRGEMALAVLDWAQRAATVWCGSNSARKRQILDSVSLNRTLSATSLVTTKRKPFDVLAERPIWDDSTPGGT